ncbi:hypothetical protein ACLOJK_031404 [Asimina triloba]
MNGASFSFESADFGGFFYSHQAAADLNGRWKTLQGRRSINGSVERSRAKREVKRESHGLAWTEEELLLHLEWMVGQAVIGKHYVMTWKWNCHVFMNLLFNMSREYLPTGGSLRLIEESVKLAYGENSDVVRDNRFAGVQALSGTGACRLFAEFQKRFHPESLIYMPLPTWANHHNIWRDAQVRQRTFRYYHPESKSLDFAALLADVKVKNHFPFFDMAYQGFASGDLDSDSQAVRIFMEDGHLIGSLTVRSQLQQIARPMYSNPPAYGALLVSTILSDQNLKNLWVEEMRVMARSIMSRRVALREKLERMGSSLNWQQITDQIGMFWYSGLKPKQVDELANKFHIYMTRDGRVR